MSRRVVFLIALISLAILGTAAAPWTLTDNGLSTALSDHMKKRYGLDLKVEGRSTFAVLPIPRVKFENVTLNLPKQGVKAEGGTLRGELRVLPLFLGQIELSDFDLSNSRITASAKALQEVNWSEIAKARADATYARRLILNQSSIRWTDLKDADLEDVQLIIRWTDAGDPLTVSGSALWRSERVLVEEASVYPELLANDRISPVSMALSSPSGKISLKGEAQLGSNPGMTGEGSLQTRSLRDFTRWSGIGLPFGSLLEEFSISGDFSMDRRRLSWPVVTVTLGKDKLEGTLAVRLDTDRPLISGTLAADDLNLSDLVAPFAHVRTSAGPWSEEAIDLTQVTSGDLDLRVSAAAARLGRVRLGDMAASVLVRPGEIEASIGRAGFHDGTLKGRLSLTALDGTTEFKSQGTFANVALASFLSSIGEPRWITGRAQGQFAFEGKGSNPVEVIGQVQGSSTVTVTDGELLGISLEDALRRVEKRPLLASLNWKGGRTPFERAHAQLSVKAGIGELNEGQLVTPDLITRLDGQVSLVERSLDLKADVSPLVSSLNPLPSIGFDISGDWDSVDVKLDARSLIERSGAAKPLFPSDRIAPDAQRPQAIAQ